MWDCPLFDKPVEPSRDNEPVALQQAVDQAYGPSAKLSLASLQKTDLVIKDKSIAGPAGLLDGFVDGAVRQPIAAVQQVFGRANEQTLNTKQESGSQTVGRIIGTLVPFVAASALTRTASNRIFGAELASNPNIYRMMGEQATAGLLMGSLLTHSDLKPGQSLLEARLRQGAESAITFGVMAGAGGALEQGLPKFGERFSAQLARRMTIGALSGTAGGLMDAELKTDFRATGDQLLTSAFGYAAFGALGEGGGIIGKALLKPGAEFAVPQAARKDTSMLLASDTNTTIISSQSGWYDKLKTAIYRANGEHTIVVTDKKWLDEGQKILLGAKRPNVTLILDETAAGSVVKPEPQVPTASEIRAEQRAQLVRNLSAELTKNGENPGDAIVAALKKNRVVLVGEYHVVDNVHRDLGAELMPRLQKEGKLTHLAIEHARDFKGKIFTADGRVDKEALPALLQHDEFYRLLESAKKAGVEVVPVDASYKGNRNLDYRNKVMDKEIGKLLGENPENKVLFWVGNFHLHTIDGTGEGAQVARLLRDKNIPVASFWGSHDNQWREEPIRSMFTPDRAIAVPTAKSPLLANMDIVHSDQPGFGINKFGEFDYVIMHPYQRPSHWD